MATVTHRLYTLSKLHQLKHEANPCDDADVRHLISRAKRAAAKRGEMPIKKTAATREPLELRLATCDGSLQGVRDRALLLFAWASGRRRRSEVAEATVEQLHKVGDDLEPRKPWQNGSDECLSMEWFRSRREAKVLIEIWRKHYNAVRPHSSLAYPTPREFKAALKKLTPQGVSLSLPAV